MGEYHRERPEEIADADRQLAASNEVLAKPSRTDSNEVLGQPFYADAARQLQRCTSRPRARVTAAPGFTAVSLNLRAQAPPSSLGSFCESSYGGSGRSCLVLN
jgi:hypothetical protein